MSEPITVRTVASPMDLNECFQIRTTVFCDEQKVSVEEEFDGLDDYCISYIAHLQGRPVGTARLQPLKENTIKIQRVAVLAECRGQGVGLAIMKRILEDLRGQNMARAVLNAQCQVRGFYEKLGFIAHGPIFKEADIDHVKMSLDLR